MKRLIFLFCITCILQRLDGQTTEDVQQEIKLMLEAQNAEENCEELSAGFSYQVNFLGDDNMHIVETFDLGSEVCSYVYRIPISAISKVSFQEADGVPYMIIEAHGWRNPEEPFTGEKYYPIVRYIPAGVEPYYDFVSQVRIILNRQWEESESTDNFQLAMAYLVNIYGGKMENH